MSFFDNPLINGFAPSWCDIAVRISPGGGPLIELGDIAAIDYNGSVELGEQREGGRVVNRTRGAPSYEASMTLYASGYQKLLAGLVAAAPLRGSQSLLSLAVFSINIQFTPPTGGGVAGQAIGAVAGALGVGGIFETRLKGCRIIGRNISAAEGVDAQQVEVPLSVLEIVDVVGGKEIVLV
ncbi:MAG TPA: hypothetical protein VGK73_33985 [Polyangiaceae bacterium]